MSIIHNLVARFKAETTAFDRNIKKSRSEITHFNKGMQSLGKQMLMFAGVGGGLYAVKRGLENATKAAMVQEKAERSLQAAVGGSIDSFKSYASEIQRLTVYGDEQILSQMAYAKNLGVTTNKLQEATTAAIGLAARFRIDLSTAMMLVGRASKGQTQMLTRYGIVLNDALSDQDKFNQLLKIGADSFRLAEADAKTAEGTFTQFRNAMSDIAETIGKPLMESLTKFAKWMVENKKQVQDFVISLERPAKAMQELYRIASVMPDIAVKNPIKPLSQQDYNMWMAGGPAAKPALPQGTLEIPPARMQHLTEMRARLREMEKISEMSRKWTEEPTFEKISAPAGMKEQVKAYRQASDIIQPYLDAINKEIALTGLVNDARQRASKMIEMENKLKKAGIKDTIAGKKAVAEMDNALRRLEDAQKLSRIAGDIGDSFASAFERAIFEGEKFRDSIKAILKDIARSVIRNLVTQPLAMGISMAIGGMLGIPMMPAPVAHGGGRVGSIGRKRNVSPFAFANAPRLHSGAFAFDPVHVSSAIPDWHMNNPAGTFMQPRQAGFGLANDEVPAILQRGETVLPKGAGISSVGINAPTINIIINNQSGTRIKQQGQPIFDGRKYIVNVVADDISSGGTLRKLIPALK